MRVWFGFGCVDVFFPLCSLTLHVACFLVARSLDGPCVALEELCTLHLAYVCVYPLVTRFGEKLPEASVITTILFNMMNHFFLDLGLLCSFMQVSTTCFPQCSLSLDFGSRSPLRVG